jgi:AraC-like DNA-binding protein
MNFLAVTIANIRRFAGPQWSPTELSFGFELGYADASNFTRAFRQLTGVTPSAFRQTAGLG